MDCLRVRDEEMAAHYLRGALDQATAREYEEHVFECDGCFAELRALRLVREELERRRGEVEAGLPSRALPWWLGVAAALTLAAGAAVVIQQWGGPPAPSREAALGELAQVAPPRYSPVRLRGAEDESAHRFTRAMEHYARGDPESALPGLREAAGLDPKAPHVQFFLGAAALLAGHTEEAVAAFRATVALGETPFLEEAHFYLAKALLRQRDLAAARDELLMVRALAGDRDAEARRLLEVIGTFAPD